MRLSMLTKFFIILFGGLALGFVFYSMLSIVSFQSQKISDNVSGYAQPVLQNPQLPSGRDVQTQSATGQQNINNPKGIPAIHGGAGPDSFQRVAVDGILGPRGLKPAAVRTAFSGSAQPIERIARQAAFSRF